MQKVEEQSIANIHVVIEKLGNKQIYSRQEFWRVVRELESMDSANHLDAIDICMSLCQRRLTLKRTDPAQTSLRSESLAGMTPKTAINGADEINIVCQQPS